MIVTSLESTRESATPLAPFPDLPELHELPAGELPLLAARIRERLMQTVTATGGHLGAGLGTVELCIALHRVFDSPRDRIVFDTGHQAYPHKILTGRSAGFDRLRQAGGLSGYPSRLESVHDLVENSHASTALSYACGLSRGFALTGQRDRRVVAVVGDGALAGGLALEALNDLGLTGSPMVVVLNDNGRSYEPTVGRLAAHLADLRNGAGAGNLFHLLGLSYLGPIDGHDVVAIEHALRTAASEGKPTIVHTVTEKGMGYPPAEADQSDRMHACGVVDPVTGRPRAADRLTWTQVFGAEIARIADEREDVVALIRRDAAAGGPSRVLGAVSRPRFRCRHRRAARGHLCRRTGDVGPASGRVHLRDVLESGVRPGADGCGAASPASHVCLGQSRGDRTGRPEPPRHVGSGLVGRGARHPHRGPPRRGAPARIAARGHHGRIGTHSGPVPQSRCRCRRAAPEHDGLNRAFADSLPRCIRHVVGYNAGWWDVHGNPRAATGKFFRPALTLAIAAAASGRTPSRPGPDVVAAALAVQLVHDFSILHDDIMDHDLMRRHQPSAWSAFGPELALLAGDTLLAGAPGLFGGADEPTAGHRRASVLSQAIMELCVGQAMDIDFEHRPTVSVADYRRMIELKTGALMGCACELGALAAGADADQVEAARELGRALGIAFQLMDDLLGIWGNPATTGKPRYTDIARRKKTLPIIITLLSPLPAARAFVRLLATDQALTQEDLRRGASVIEQAAGRAQTQSDADATIRRAMNLITHVAANEPAGEELRQLAQIIVGRSR